MILIVAGLNNAGGNMIMTNSSMNSIGSMGGGGLVVSSGAVNKPLLTSTQNMIGAQSHHPGGHNVPQVCSQSSRSSLVCLNSVFTSGLAKWSHVE